MIDIVGCDHSEDIEDLKGRIPNKDFERLFHEDFRDSDDLNKVNALKKFLLIPFFLVSFKILSLARYLRRNYSLLRAGGLMSRKTDYTFRKNSSIDDVISIDSNPWKTLERHDINKGEIKYNYGVLSLWIIFLLSGIFLRLPNHIFLIGTITISLLLSSDLLRKYSIFGSYEERDKYMSDKIIENTCLDDAELVIVGDYHVLGLKDILSEQLEEEINTYKIS